MFKKLLKLGLLSLLITLIFSITIFAQSDSNNPFASIDKEYDERLKIIKNMPEDYMSLQRDRTIEELHKKESDTLDSHGKRYIIKFKEDSSMQEIFDAISSYNYKILGKSKNRLFMLELVDHKSFQQQSKDIIEFIEEDIKRKVNAANIVPSDPYYHYQWGHPATNIPEAWEISKGSNSVYVAVIDSGIYRGHPDLISSDIRNGWDYIFYEFCDWDSTGHGTNVTGIIGAGTNNYIGIAGVNWDVSIIPLRVAYSDGTAYNSDVITAIYDAADIGCDVINLSMGSSEYSSAEDYAISYAISQNCIVVASAGNGGNSEYSYPASYDGVISVGSIGNDFRVSNFSQYNNKVDVTAPGEDIFTTAVRLYEIGYYGYAFVDGTSFSTPYVSGIAALVSSVEPSITADEFMDILKVTSTDLGSPGYDIHYGYGLINAEKILQSFSIINVQSVSLNKGNITLSVGDYEELIATVFPLNATNQNVIWKSDNPSVATVDNGNIKAVSSGTAIITVTTEEGRKTDSTIVKVIDPKEEGQIWDLFEDVELDKVWTIKFNMKLDDTSWKDNVYILDSNNEEFPISISVSSDKKSIIVTPLIDYNYNSEYTMIIDNSIISETGNKLKDRVYVPFITRGWPMGTVTHH